MTDSTFVPTQRQQVSVCFAYLAYSGELLTSDNQAPAVSVPMQILDIMNETMPKLPPLLNGNTVDWQVVWGPAIYTFPGAEFQDNLLYVVQQISQPTNYVVGVRGTNAKAILDWIEEDLKVWVKVDWKVPFGVSVQGSPKISKATADGIDVLLNKLIPDGVPGNGQNITAFLSSIAAENKVNLLFTGHSLGGALSPTLALWFKQSQKLAGDWDPNGNATISVVSFAGPTAGNADFAAFFNAQLGNACDRIYNTLDVVPHAWEEATLHEIPTLYSPEIEMTLAEKLLLDFIEATVKDYTQVNTGDPVTWTVQPTAGPSFLDQVGTQHDDSYPVLLGVPELLTAINNGKSA